MIRAGENASEVHGMLFQRERRIQVDLTLTRGVRNTTKRMLVNGQRPKSRAELADALPFTVFTPEGVDIVRQGPENRRLFLTNLMTDVEPTSGDVIERFARILSQRNALLRALAGERPTSARSVTNWTCGQADFCNVSDELLLLRSLPLDDVAPLVAHYYHELAEDDAPIKLSYERSWRGDLANALRDALDDDRFRGHTTIGPQRDDIATSSQRTRHETSGVTG
jgi:DNA replication and repair protein RecF